jgi:hypothetical protein
LPQVLRISGLRRSPSALPDTERMNEPAWEDSPARNYYEWKARIQKT